MTANSTRIVPPIITQSRKMDTYIFSNVYISYETSFKTGLMAMQIASCYVLSLPTGIVTIFWVPLKAVLVPEKISV